MTRFVPPRGVPFVIALAIAGALVPASSVAEEKEPPGAGAIVDREAEYARTIEKRAADIVAVLDLKDDAKAKPVHAAIVTQYRALRDWHDANGPEMKSLTKKTADKSAAGPDVDAARKRLDEIKASMNKLHDAYLSELSEHLDETQVEKVKDKMTYNVVRVTYDAYNQMLPALTDAQKAKILETLKVAREEAMDGGSADEKHAIFGRYKGRINNYLAAEGYDLKKASKDLADRSRAAKPARTPGETADAQPAATGQK